MSKKIIITIIAVIVVVAGVLSLNKKGNSSTSTTMGTTPAADQTQTAPVTKGDNSDAALNSDLQTVSGNLTGLDNQSSSVDQSLNQQPVDPTQ